MLHYFPVLFQIKQERPLYKTENKTAQLSEKEVNVVKLTLQCFLLYIYITLTTTKKIPKEQSSNLHTPYYTTTIICYLAIFTAIPRKFQGNDGFSLQNTEKQWPLSHLPLLTHGLL